MILVVDSLMITLIKIKRKISSVINRIWTQVRIGFYQVLSELKPSGKPIKVQPVLFMGKGKVLFGENVRVGWKYSKLFFSYSYIEARNDTAQIIIGDNVHFNNGCTIVCDTTTIEIGDNCLIGPNCEFMDSDFHALAPLERHSGKPRRKKIQIGDNVFLGANVVISKGVTIGDNSVIGANSVVVANIPKNTLAAGNPARVIRALTD